MTNTLNYTKELNKNNRINATIGVEESLSRSYIMRQTAEGLTSESIGWKNMMLAETSKLEDNEVSKMCIRDSHNSFRSPDDKSAFFLTT